MFLPEVTSQNCAYRLVCVICIAFDFVELIKQMRLVNNIPITQ